MSPSCFLMYMTQKYTFKMNAVNVSQTAEWGLTLFSPVIVEGWSIDSTAFLCLISCPPFMIKLYWKTSFMIQEDCFLIFILIWKKDMLIHHQKCCYKQHFLPATDDEWEDLFLVWERILHKSSWILPQISLNKISSSVCWIKICLQSEKVWWQWKTAQRRSFIFFHCA